MLVNRYISMEFKENNNGNLVANTPSGSTLVVYNIKDEYGGKTQRWSWMATRYNGVKKYANEEFCDPETAQKSIEDTIKITSSTTNQEIKPKDTFEYVYVEI